MQQQQSPESHVPFPIADFVEGLFLAKEPWLSPRNAFQKIINFRAFRGQLRSRTGSVRLANLSFDSADQTGVRLGSPVPDPDDNDKLVWSYVPDLAQLDSFPVPESLKFVIDTDSDAGVPVVPVQINAEMVLGSEKFHATGTNGPAGNGFDHFTYDVVNTGGSTVIGYHWVRSQTVTPGSAQWGARLKWEDHPDWVERSVVDNDSMTYRRRVLDPVIGLARLQADVGDYSIAFDLGRAYVLTADSYYQAQGKGGSYADYMSSNTKTSIWTWPLEDYIVFTNGIGPVHRWDPVLTQDSSIVEMDTDWDPNFPGTNQLDTAQLVLRFRGRLLYLNTKESTNNFLHRVRWTSAADFNIWDGANSYLDAPSEYGAIVTAEFIGDRLFVGFQRGWMELLATGDNVLPFEWRPFITRFGAVSKNSSISDNERILTRSKTTMQAVDPNGQYYLDEEMPDLVKNYSAVEFAQCSGFRNEGERAFWWTYVAAGKEAPDNTLVATYDEKGNLAWSEYDHGYRDLSSFNPTLSPTWNSLGPKPWRDYSNVTWNNAATGVSASANVIGAGLEGTVFLTGLVNTDYDPRGPTPINMELRSQKLAPFPGQRSHFGWLDVFANSAENVTLDILFYREDEHTAYLSRQIDLTPLSGSGKVWRRMPVDMVSAFHRFSVFCTSDVAVAIDAFVPYFRPAGRVRPFN